MRRLSLPLLLALLLLHGGLATGRKKLLGAGPALNGCETAKKPASDDHELQGQDDKAPAEGRKSSTSDDDQPDINNHHSMPRQAFTDWENKQPGAGETDVQLDHGGNGAAGN